jgi:hypothetical protein
MIPIRTAFAGLVLASAGSVVQAKPIAFANGTTVMAEYGAGTMNEAQVFYAPKYFYSLGAGFLELDSDIEGRRREITYVRANYLAKRWNLEDAQANVFVWGGVGQAYVSETNDHTFAWNTGAQVDYETRRIYSSLKTDLHHSSEFSHRIDTLQLGICALQARHRHPGPGSSFRAAITPAAFTMAHEWAFLLRLFKGGAWIEAGATTDGKLQAMAMVNF